MLYSWSDTVLIAINKVLRPILANLFSSLSRLRVDEFESLSLMMLSAPLVYILMVFPLLTRTDILFLSEVKAKTYRSYIVFSLPLILIVAVDCAA